jgi:hypothetical protein
MYWLSTIKMDILQQKDIMFSKNLVIKFKAYEYNRTCGKIYSANAKSV